MKRLASTTLLICLALAAPAQAVDDPEAQALLDQIAVYENLYPNQAQLAEINGQYQVFSSCLKKAEQGKQAKRQLKNKKNRRLWRQFKRLLTYNWQETASFRVQKDSLLAQAAQFQQLNFEDLDLDAAAFYGADIIELRVEQIGLRDRDACQIINKAAKQKKWSAASLQRKAELLEVPSTSQAKARSNQITKEIDKDRKAMAPAEKRLEELGADEEEMESFYIFASGLNSNFIVRFVD